MTDTKHPDVCRVHRGDHCTCGVDEAPHEGSMDVRTKRYIDDVLKALGQMAHERTTPGRMTMDVDLRSELITRGAYLVGLFPVGNWKPIPDTDD